MSKYTEYELATYKGRVIDDEKSPGYCGSCSIELHCEQLRDPKSWVHSSVARWEMLGGLRTAQEQKQITIDRAELKRLQADSARLEFMLREQCIMHSQNGSSSPIVHSLAWPIEGAQQTYWYPTERESIDAAMLPAAPQGDSHE